MAKKPKIGGLLDDVAEKVIKPEPQGIRAYHGSPHDFDRFDLSKIGTGEGAQAYGHGLYFAEAEPIAKEYRDKLSRQVSFDGASVSNMHPSDSATAAAVHAISKHIADGVDPVEAVKREAEQWARSAYPYLQFAKDNPQHADRAIQQAQSFQNIADEILRLDLSKFSKNPGHMYEVNIRANPDDFLDWDKPLVAQEPIVNKMADYYAKTLDVPADMAREELTANRLLTGSNLYRDNAAGLAGTKPGTPLYQANYDQTAASRQLLEAGIPGIKYLDAGSRAAGDGSRNYVVFDDKLIDILRKYGIVPAGLLGAGAAMAPSNADAAPSRPDWIGDNGAITANPPWLRPDPNERSTLGKLYDAVTTNPVGTFKAAGSALGDAVKGYLGEVRQDPGKGVADALELGATAMGGAAPQAFWMATSPDTANAGEDAILAQRRKMMQGLLAD